MAGRVSGRTAIVTGAAQGIGRSIAKRLSEEGADVVIADAQEDLAHETASALDSDVDATVTAVPCDVTSIDDARRLAGETVETFGSIDVLVNNAGVGSRGYFPDDIGPEEWHRVVDVNLHGVYNCTHATVPSMIDRGFGRVINISSMAGRGISYHGGANYTTSKWGVIGFTKHLAWDLGEHRITVNAVCPGSTLTPLIRSHTTEEERAETAEGIPLGRWATPEDQANGVLYLASDEAAYVTGTVLEIDGGKQLNPRHDA